MIVSLVSAGIGAVVMVTLLHCRRSVRRFETDEIQRGSLSLKPGRLDRMEMKRELSTAVAADSIEDGNDRREDLSGRSWNFELKYESVNTCALSVPVRLLSKSVQKRKEEREGVARYGSAIR